MISAETPSLPPPLFDIFCEQHRQKIILGITLFVVLLVFTGGFLLWQRSERLAANGLLSSATDVAGWQAVVSRYPHSGAAADALLLIAGAQATNHQCDDANKTYAQFLKTFSHHPLAVSAYLGMAMNEDSMGHPEKALAAFQQAVAMYPRSYAAPEALMLQARLLARLGKKEEAKRLLQMIATQYPDSLVSTIVLKQK